MSLAAIKLFFAPVVAFLAAVPLWVWAVIVYGASLYGACWYTERETRKEVTAFYEGQIAEVSKSYRLAEAQSIAETDALLAGLHLELANAKNQKEKTRTIIKEVKVYVTEKADAQCKLTTGFVWLHNAALAGEDGIVPESRPADVDAETGVKISEVAATVGDNYAECAERGKVIKAWQDWYVAEKEIYQRAQRIIESAAER